MISNSNTTYHLNHKQDEASKPRTKMRFVVCTLGLLSLVLTQMSRMVVNVSIVSMVDPKMIKTESEVSTGGSCPQIDPQVRDQSPVYEIDSTKGSEFYLDTEAYPYHSESETSHKYHANITSRESVTIIGDVPRYEWTIKEQSAILGGFFYSYFLFMILGARLSEIYGAKYVIMLGVAVSALITLLTPWMASQSLYLLIASRIVMGAVQSGVFPSTFALINKWLTMGEACIFAPLTKMNLRFGMLAASVLPGLVPKWPNVFYIAGVCGLVWSVLWFFIATSEPKDNKWVSESELEHIMKKKKKIQVEEEKDDANKKTSKSSPWIMILTSPSVIALVLIKTTFNFGTIFSSVYVPTYLKYVFHARRQTISAITSGLFLIQVLLCVVVGYFAKTMVKRRPFGMNKTGVRIFFQTIASGVTGVLLVMLTFHDCNLTYTAILLQVIAFTGMFTAGGETVLPYDLSEEYPATILAIANSISNFGAILVPVLTGMILNNEGGSSYRWNIIIDLIAGSNILGWLVFSFLVKAEPINFDKKQNSQDDIEDVAANTKAVL